jgi:hypothetical protein
MEKKLYLLKADDVYDLIMDPDNPDAIKMIVLKPGGRIVQIDDTVEGRGVLTSHIRRVVGAKASSRLISGEEKKADA